MDGTIWSLLLAAAGVAVIHTVLGPDHYLPFIFLGRARGWSVPRTLGVTGCLGAAHVASSMLLGGIGLLLGVAVGRLEQWEQARGGLAAWALVAFGLAYGSWGLRKAMRRSRGLEPHSHDGHVHLHRRGDRPHGHSRRFGDTKSVSFWTLFAIFVLGPCEPLIPLFVLPASRGRWDWALWTALVFGAVTIASMIGATLVGLIGLRPIATRRLERYSHALAGGVIAASGAAILLLGV